MSQAEDLDAINEYFASTDAKTQEAVALKDAWIRWFDGLSDYSIYFDGATYDEARNRRTAFDRANATTPREQAAVETRLKQGMTTEETEGQPRRLDSSGNYYVPPPSKAPTTLVTVVAVGVGVFLLTNLIKAVKS